MNSKIFLVSFLLAITVYSLDALSCAPCNKNRKCPRLPLDPDECYRVKSPCGCCDVCAGEEGERCGRFFKRCRPGLVCRNRFRFPFKPKFSKPSVGSCQELGDNEIESPDGPERPDRPDGPETPDLPEEPDRPDGPEWPERPERPDGFGFFNANRGYFRKNRTLRI